jgi:hypothetical protein
MAVLAAAPAWADNWRGHFGFYFGVPLYAPYPYYYPRPYYPYPVPYYVYPPAPYGLPGPPAYVEHGDAQAPAQQPEPPYWYYCPDSNAYYPYVRQCPSPWQRVPQQPPATTR